MTHVLRALLLPSMRWAVISRIPVETSYCKRLILFEYSPILSSTDVKICRRHLHLTQHWSDRPYVSRKPPCVRLWSSIFGMKNGSLKNTSGSLPEGIQWNQVEGTSRPVVMHCVTYSPCLPGYLHTHSFI